MKALVLLLVTVAYTVAATLAAVKHFTLIQFVGAFFATLAGAVLGILFGSIAFYAVKHKE